MPKQIAVQKPRGMHDTAWESRRKLMAYLDTLKLPDGVKAIPLSRMKYALVDASDYDFLMEWTWQYSEGYAKRSVYGDSPRRVIAMHGAILGTPDGLEPDHINGNRIDNRRRNLRPATHQQNMWNRKAVTGSSSTHKGVDWYAASGSWRAYIKIDGKQKHLGCYAHEDDAARAYNKAAIALHGAFARLNLVEGDPAPRIIHPYMGKQRKKGAANDRVI